MTHGPGRVRRAAPGDEPKLRDLRIRALTESPEQFGSTLEREQARADWSSWIQPNATFLWETADGPMGLAAGVEDWDDATSAFLMAMWVDPRARGAGAGDALVTAVLAWAKETGYRRIRLHVVEGNDPARNLYERHGFHAVGTVERERDGIVEVEMHRPLSPAGLSLYAFLDWHYGEAGGDRELRRRIKAGDILEHPDAPFADTPLLTATRRRRTGAVDLLARHGANLEARNHGGKTAYVHARRRGFMDVVAVLQKHGASTHLEPADAFAVAVSDRNLEEAQKILEQHPGVIRTGNPEEDRLLADMAGRPDPEPVAFLITAGADLTAPALDSGTPLHQAAWFGEPRNARLLVEAGAPLEVFDRVHEGSPLGWAVHGSRYSGGAGERQDRYVELVTLFLDAGASLHYPGDPGSDAYYRRLSADAGPQVKPILEARWTAS